MLAKADKVIRQRAADRHLAVDSVHITLPDPIHLNSDFVEAYGEAGRRLNAAIATGGFSCTWKRIDETCMLPSNSYFDAFGPQSVQVSLTFDTFRQVANSAIRVAEAFSRTDSKHSSSWCALNPRKGEIDRRPGWADELYSSRIVASDNPR